MDTTPQLSGLQLDVMRVLWEQGQATVADVHEVLSEKRGLALTTVATLLSRLKKRGLLAHKTQGRQYVYRPLVAESEVRRSMVAELTERLFEGDAAALVSHLITHRDFSAEDLLQVKALIESRAEDELEGEGS